MKGDGAFAGGVILGALAAGSIIFAAMSHPYDNSDPPSGRSNLIIRTDSLTGCEYLRDAVGGGITPRMGKDGKQVCT
jgi:hypothetical protein